MKKHVLKIASVLFLSAAYGCAQNAVTPSGRMFTYRIGGGFAGEYASIDADVQNRPAFFPGDGDFSSHFHHSCRKFQMSPSIELGAFLYDTYYLGFVFSKHYTHVKSSMKVPMTYVYNFEHTLGLKSYLNAFLKIGYKPTPRMLFFGLIGPSFANWSHNTRLFKYSNEDRNDATKDIKNSEMRIKTTGLGFGGGMEYWVSKNTTVSFQYTAHVHRAKNIRYDYRYDLLVPDDEGFTVPIKRNGYSEKSVRLSYSTIGVRFSYFFSF